MESDEIKSNAFILQTHNERAFTPPLEVSVGSVMSWLSLWKLRHELRHGERDASAPNHRVKTERLFVVELLPLYSQLALTNETPTRSCCPGGDDLTFTEQLTVSPTNHRFIASFPNLFCGPFTKLTAKFHLRKTSNWLATFTLCQNMTWGEIWGVKYEMGASQQKRDRWEKVGHRSPLSIIQVREIGGDPALMCVLWW